MRLRLFLLTLAVALLPSLSCMAATLTGVVVNGDSGSPLSGATVLLRDSNVQASTNFNGQFRIDVPDNSDVYLIVTNDGFTDFVQQYHIGRGTVNAGEIRIFPSSNDELFGEIDDLMFD